MPSKKVNLMESVGLVSKETIVNYPPGIPLIGAGEIIQEKHLEFLKNKDYIEVLL
jgi:arginine/lysine/ornithine decarboxylase